MSVTACMAWSGWSLAAPGAAHASCIAPTPKVIWSYPSAGEVDVPLDSDLLVLTEGVWLDVQVTLDGEPVSAGSAFRGHYDLGALEPGTTYTVAIDTADGTQPAAHLSWQFTTGDAPLDQDVPLAVTIQSASASQFEFDDEVPCSDAMLADTCFDTGYPTLFSFETDVEDAALWVVEPVVKDPAIMPGHWIYPGECGQPRTLGYMQLAPDEQYRVHAILPDGTIVSSDPVSVPFMAPNADPGPAAGTAGSGASDEMPMAPASPGADEPAGGDEEQPAADPVDPGAGAQGDDPPAPSMPAGESVGEEDDAAMSASACAVRDVRGGRAGFALPLLAAAAWLLPRRRRTP